MDNIHLKAHNKQHMNDLNKQLKRLVDSGLNDAWIATHLNIDIEIVKDAQVGIYTPPLGTGPKRTAKLSGTKRLVPVSMTFPELPDDMPDTRRIIVLTKHGMSAEKIRRHLKTDIEGTAINRYAAKKLGPARTGNNSHDNQLSVTFLPYMHECLERLGKDRYKCEICLDPVPKGATVHHTKYEGATIYDLLYVCQSCNLARENKGLT